MEMRCRSLSGARDLAFGVVDGEAKKREEVKVVVLLSRTKCRVLSSVG